MILFVGNFDSESLARAQKIKKDAVTIFDTDLNSLSKISVGFISICDHTIDNFLLVLEHASELYYIPSDKWNNQTAKTKTESWLRYFSHKKIVYNLSSTEQIPMLDLIDQRKTTEPQVWVAGCSCTSADGVHDSERWGQLVADQLGMHSSFLAKRGTSIPWAADQLLRSDIRKDDIVLWAPTGVSRVTFYNGQGFDYIVNTPINNAITKQYLASDHIFYQSLTSIAQVIQRTKDVGATLVILLIPLFIEEQETILFQYLSEFNFFILGYRSDSFIDVGSDGFHPGPLHHRYWADLVLDKLDKLLT